MKASLMKAPTLELAGVKVNSEDNTGDIHCRSLLSNNNESNHCWLSHEEALDLLTCAWRVNRRNVVSFERRLDQLTEIGRDLRAGRYSAAEAIARAEELGFIAPLDLDATEVAHA